MSNISVIIPTYNGARFIREALKSVFAQTLVPHEVIIVDDTSSDETVAIVAKEFPQVKMLRNEHNRGFGATCNRGIQEALYNGADAVCLINQDLRLHLNCIATLTAAMQQHPGFGLLSAFQVAYDGDVIDPGFHGWAPKSMWSDLFLGRMKGVYSVDFMPAAAVLIRRETLLNVGGFDPLFHMYGEDDDLCHRMITFGWKIGLAPKAIAYHWNGGFHANRNFRWHVNFEYSRAVLHLKKTQVPFPLAFFTPWSCWRVRGSSWTQLLARLPAYFKCLWRARQVWRHRSQVPFAFSESDAVGGVGKSSNSKLPNSSSTLQQT